jgi:integrase
VSAKTIRNRHGLLYAAMRRQQERGVIASNPCEGVRIGRSARRAEMVTLSPVEFSTVLEALPGHWHPLVITLAGTGLRFGEATALQVRDLDLDADPPTLRVARAWKHTDGHGRELGAPKTEKGRRLVSLPPQVVDAIRPVVAGRAREAFVFTNTAGRPIRQNSFHEVWTAALARTDLGKRPRPHDLRHTHVSWLIAAGVPLPVIQRRLGHEKITTTVDTYGHLADDALSVAAQAASIALPVTVPALEAGR